LVGAIAAVVLTLAAVLGRGEEEPRQAIPAVAAIEPTTPAVLGDSATCDDGTIYVTVGPTGAFDSRNPAGIDALDRDGKQRPVIRDISPQAPADLTLHGRYIYFTQSLDADGAVWRSRLDGSGVRAIVPRTVNGVGVSGYGLAVSDKFLYFGSGSDIWRANLDGTDARLFLDAEGVDPVRAIAVTDSHIFWTSGWGIARAQIDGSDVQERWRDTDSDGYNDALFATNTHLYYANDGFAGRMTLDGDQLEERWFNLNAELGTGQRGWGIGCSHLYLTTTESRALERVRLADGGGRERIAKLQRSPAYHGAVAVAVLPRGETVGDVSEPLPGDADASESPSGASTAEPSTPSTKIKFTPSFRTAALPAVSSWSISDDYVVSVTSVRLKGFRLHLTLDASGPTYEGYPERSCLLVHNPANETQVFRISPIRADLSMRAPGHYSGTLVYPLVLPGEYEFLYECGSWRSYSNYSPTPIGTAHDIPVRGVSLGTSRDSVVAIYDVRRWSDGIMVVFGAAGRSHLNRPIEACIETPDGDELRARSVDVERMTSEFGAAFIGSITFPATSGGFIYSCDYYSPIRLQASPPTKTAPLPDPSAELDFVPSFDAATLPAVSPWIVSDEYIAYVTSIRLKGFRLHLTLDGRSPTYASYPEKSCLLVHNPADETQVIRISPTHVDLTMTAPGHYSGTLVYPLVLPGAYEFRYECGHLTNFTPTPIGTARDIPLRGVSTTGFRNSAVAVYDVRRRPDRVIVVFGAAGPSNLPRPIEACIETSTGDESRPRRVDAQRMTGEFGAAFIGTITFPRTSGRFIYSCDFYSAIRIRASPPTPPA
jgi:hypothetical protein